MANCSECRFWEMDVPTFGFCDRVDRDNDFEIIVRVSDDTGLSTRLRTGFTFGCNLHEFPLEREPDSDNIDLE